MTLHDTCSLATQHAFFTEAQTGTTITGHSRQLAADVAGDTLVAVVQALRAQGYPKAAAWLYSQVPVEYWDVT